MGGDVSVTTAVLQTNERDSSAARALGFRRLALDSEFKPTEPLTQVPASTTSEQTLGIQC